MNEEIPLLPTAPIPAVIFDWAGTCVDYGSRAPVTAFIELFAGHGVILSAAEARGPMGTPKKDHIRALLTLPSVSCAWQKIQGSAPGEADVERLYSEFGPLQTDVISRHCDVIPGTAQVLSLLRRQRIRIGSTTGYASFMMRDLITSAARDGFDPECIVCGDDVRQGRPAPWMALHAAMLLDAYPVTSCVKVGDTIADIDEGRNAGMWTIAVTRTGNEIGLSEAEVNALDPADLQNRLERACGRMRAAGPNYVIEGIKDLPTILDEIAARIHRGERP